MKSFFYEVLMVPLLWLATCLAILVLAVGCEVNRRHTCARGDEVCELAQRVLAEPARKAAEAHAPEEPVVTTGTRIKNRQ